MLYEMRTYRLQTGALPAYLRIVGDEGIEIQKGHLGHLVGYFYSEIGPLNEIVHVWAYAGLDERETRRAALAADPLWQAILAKIMPLIETMENKILKATSFSPLP